MTSPSLNLRVHFLQCFSLLRSPWALARSEWGPRWRGRLFVYKQETFITWPHHHSYLLFPTVGCHGLLGILEQVCAFFPAWNHTPCSTPLSVEVLIIPQDLIQITISVKPALTMSSTASWAPQHLIHNLLHVIPRPTQSHSVLSASWAGLGGVSHLCIH